MVIEPQFLLLGGIIAGVTIVVLAMLYIFFSMQKDDQTRSSEQVTPTAERVKAALIGGVLILIPIILIIVTLFIRTIPSM